MADEQKKEPVKTETTNEVESILSIKVPVQDLPSRADIRSILKSGKDAAGREVHPDSVKMLRGARIADLFAFGQEVNKANAELVRLVTKALDSIDLSFKEVHWNFATFMSFMAENGYLKEGALEAFEKFKAQAEEDLIKGTKEILEKAETAKPAQPNILEATPVPEIRNDSVAESSPSPSK